MTIRVQKIQVMMRMRVKPKKVKVTKNPVKIALSLILNYLVVI